MASRKLRHYFEAHKITVLTDQPLNDLFINKEASSRIAKWATELSEHTINFGKRSAIKSQVLADFVVDWTSLSNTAGDEELVPVWEIRCDGAWGRKGAGIAASERCTPTRSQKCVSARSKQFSGQVRC
jgi:hypothetical protein